MVIGLVICHVRSLVHSIRSGRSSSFNATLAHHQKMHEGERW
jgi:hypothetical protein